jgi:calcineurin-like phosphoesterase family protein
MDETIIGNINKCVDSNSILFHLGDFAMPGRQHDYFYRCQYYRNRINCRTIIYLYGNHDGAELETLFTRCADLMSDVVVNHQQFSLCHYAQVVWNKNHGRSQSINLYGHSHSSAEPWMDSNMLGHRSMDVGIDNAYKLLGEYRPFSFQEIMEIMSKRTGFSMDHHV